MQDNILASDQVVTDAAYALEETDGDIASDHKGNGRHGSRRRGGVAAERCTCETEPYLMPPATVVTRTIAYILAADPDGMEGDSFNDGNYFMYIDVTDENIEASEVGTRSSLFE